MITFAFTGSKSLWVGGDIHSQNVKGSFLSSLVLGPHPAAALPYTSEPSCESSKA
jgi:hypothetical protein